VAMQFTEDVVWSLADFVVAGALLGGTGLTLEMAARKAGNMAYRAAAGIALAGALFLVWVNLAVGIIGTEDDPANLMYFGLVGVGLVGAAVARFRPGGMQRTLFAMTVGQLAVGGIALVAGLEHTLPLDACFAALWAGSALLFRQAGAKGSELQPTG